jgi:hypothetical protein
MKGENIKTHGVSSFYCLLEWVWIMPGRVKERVSYDLKILRGMSCFQDEWI